MAFLGQNGYILAKAGENSGFGQNSFILAKADQKCLFGPKWLDSCKSSLKFIFLGQNGFSLTKAARNCVCRSKWLYFGRGCWKLCAFATIALFRPNHRDQMSQTGQLVQTGHYD